MPAVISHNSALELLRAVPPQVRAYPRVSEALDMGLISTDFRELRRLDNGLTDPYTLEPILSRTKDYLQNYLFRLILLWIIHHCCCLNQMMDIKMKLSAKLFHLKDRV